MKTDTDGPARDPIYGLDAIRFAAALLVTVYHFGFRVFDGSAWAHGYVPLPPIRPAWWSVTWFGWVGVQVFFVISGLVIAYSARGATPGSFLRGRVARLVPAMLICASIAAALEIGVYGMDPARAVKLWAKSIVFLPFGPWISGQFWTLPIEVAFYAIILAMIRFNGVRHLLALGWVLGLASLAYWVVFAAGWAVDGHGRLTQLIPLQHGCYFALGIALAHWADPVPPRSMMPLVILTVLTSVIQVREAAYGEHLPFRVADQWPVAWAVFGASILGIMLSMSGKHAIACRIGGRTARILRAAGLLTYPLYLVHFQLGCATMAAAIAAGFPIGVAAILATLAAIVAALVVALWLEPPLHRTVKRLLARGAMAGGRA